MCGAEDVIDALIEGMGHKSPKCAPACVGTMVEMVTAFGALNMPFKKLLAKAVMFLEHKDKKVKDEAIKLIVEVGERVGEGVVGCVCLGGRDSK